MKYKPRALNPTDSPLRALRKARGFSMREVAALVGCSAGMLSKVERGEKPSDRLTQRLVVVFKNGAAAAITADQIQNFGKQK